MNILNFSNFEKIYAIGDIHGSFKSLLLPLKQKIKNSIFFIAGDIGLGFESDEYYQVELNKINKVLTSNNNILLCLRGNHDNPIYFNEEKLNFSNIKFIPDYTLVITKNYSTLCVGGAISYDRTWRLKQEFLINKYKSESSKHRKTLYWANEPFVYDENKLNEIIDNGYTINSVITHICPNSSQINKKELQNLNYWIEIDEKLKYDLELETANIQKLYDFLTSKNPITFWVSGHLHVNNWFKENNINFIQLSNDYRIRDIDSVISEIKFREEHVSMYEDLSKLKFKPIKSAIYEPIEDEFDGETEPDEETNNQEPIYYNGDILENITQLGTVNTNVVMNEFATSTTVGLANFPNVDNIGILGGMAHNETNNF